MEKKQTLKIGEKAANFTLDDQNDNPFTLYDFKRKKILLSFHPLAWTAFCAGQMESLEKNRDILESLNTLAVGISVDSVPCKKATRSRGQVEQALRSFRLD